MGEKEWTPHQMAVLIFAVEAEVGMAYSDWSKVRPHTLARAFVKHIAPTARAAGKREAYEDAGQILDAASQNRTEYWWEAASDAIWGRARAVSEGGALHA